MSLATPRPPDVEWISGKLNLDDLMEIVSGAIGIGMADQRHDYRGYRIDIRRHAGGRRATIYAPDSDQPMLGPQSDDQLITMKSWIRRRLLLIPC
jgi:hypothetical protein